jgi:pimeloyl-ACP methyl ester carboxylesterase
VTRPALWGKLSSVMRGARLAVVLSALAPAVACGGSAQRDSDPSSAAGGQAGATGEAGASAGGAAGAGGTSGAAAKSCLDAPLPEAQFAASPKPYSGGTCPELVSGKNTLTSNGNARSFLLAIPSELDPSESLPLIFMWHWLGGSARSFQEKAEVQQAVDEQRFLAVLPESKDDIPFKWPATLADPDARLEEELVFFDDMLACVSEKFPVARECVSTAGVSMGALFSAQLASRRGEYLASLISLSGGVGGVIRGWGNPQHRMASLVLWGGPTDNCLGVMNFEQTSKTLETALVDRGHFLVECVHNCGHSEPPFDAPPGMSTYAALWDFVFAHPFWLPAGVSPYSAGLPAHFPTWCAVGRGSATPRTGECPNPSGC